MTRTAFVHAEGGPTYNLGDDHPMTPLRRQLAVDLIRAYGLDQHPDVVRITPDAAPDEVIERVHTPAYVAAVRRYSANPMLASAWEAGQWGLAAGGDTPAFAGMHEAAAAICGASVAGAMAVWEGRADQAFVAGGGLHHAMANRAAGLLHLQRHRGRHPGAPRRRAPSGSPTSTSTSTTATAPSGSSSRTRAC